MDNRAEDIMESLSWFMKFKHEWNAVRNSLINSGYPLKKIKIVVRTK